MKENKKTEFEVEDLDAETNTAEENEEPGTSSPKDDKSRFPINLHVILIAAILLIAAISV